jgi:hypothetical protein
MMQTEALTTQLLTRGRQIKFTPERLQQIRNLVERGKSREEIAELIGVTVGSLQVTCSRLGISLRRVVFANATGLLRPSGSHPNNGTTTTDTPTCGVSVPLPPIKEQLQQKAASPHQGSAKTNDVDWANLALKMQYRGDERTTKLALTQDMIGKLALEAQIRDMSIGEFVGELIITVMKKDLFQRVLPPTICGPSCPANAEDPQARQLHVGCA